MVRPKRVYSPEHKARAIDLCLQAIIFGWSVHKFSKLARLPRVTVLTWLMDDTVFDRYTRAMQIKALALPTMANDIIERVINGKLVRRVETLPDGEIREHVERVFLDPKAAGVAIRHIEFRIQREIKKIYEQSSTKTHNVNFHDMTDSDVDRRIAEHQKKLMAGIKKGPGDAGPVLQ